MTVCETRLVSRTGDEADAEDAIVITPSFACVIDGTTSKSERLWEGQKSGIVAARLLSRAVQELPEALTGPEAIARLSASVAAYYERVGAMELVRLSPGERCAASVAIYSNLRREIWLVGDCQALVGDKLHSNRLLLEDIMANARSLFLDMEIKSGATVDELLRGDVGRDAISPWLERQAVYENAYPDSPYSYASIDGFEVPAGHIRILPVPSGVHDVILATDGYPFLKRTLQESEIALETLLRDDPLCMSAYKATKGLESGYISYDDRAFVRLAV